ncbi:unnamed protein product [Cladocopium goreaui]|uniref:Short-chain dehydrogenase n=1 Tax=Cladocopium goreaui TaxID=2562237 RepID=A0A9P1DSA4_9DINO|nr:unnamed protein product [Cladocopium goreaui]
MASTSVSPVAGKVCVVTGGGSGIGAALCQHFASLGAKKVVVADLNEAAASAVAQGIQGLAVRCNVAEEMDLRRLLAVAETLGPVEIFVANAGIPCNGGYEVPNDEWERIFKVHVMQHVFVARHLFPLWQQRPGEKHLVITASAAGLLTQAVETGMIPEGSQGGVAGGDGMLKPEEVAKEVVKAMALKKFLILPHPEVLTYFQRKASDYERWLKGMGKLQKNFGDLIRRSPPTSAAKL